MVAMTGLNRPRGEGGGGNVVEDGGVRTHGGAYDGTWAQMLGSTLPTSLKKNVLEIVLDKDERGAFMVSDHDCAKVMGKLGLDNRPGIHVESVQICPNGRGVILITLKDNIPLERFCRYDVIEITESGIRAVNVKPAGKRDVVINIKGLHPNTMDEGVIEYLGKYGRVVTTKVVYGTFGEGPLKGLRNGDRSYKVELQPNTNIGTYHLLDGNKVTMRYPGQHSTCARCHQVARDCKGGGIARRCEAAGGIKVDFSQYIQRLWESIGYSPDVLDIAAAYDDHGEGVEVHQLNQQVGGGFTPAKVISNPDKFTGVIVKQFPKETDDGDVMEFLIRSGLPNTSKDNVLIKPNGAVTIKNIPNDICRVLIENIHNKRNFNRNLFCNGIIPLTPAKAEASSDQVQGLGTSTPPATRSLLTSSPSGSDPKLVQEEQVITDVPAPLVTQPALEGGPPNRVSTFVSGLQSTDPPATALEESALEVTPDLARRHSLSLRSPPPGSLADELLNNPGTSLKKTRNLLADIRDMTEKLSDFGSCMSSLSSEENDSSSYPLPDGDGGWAKIGKKKKKRKYSSSPPDKNYFLKKLDSKSSPGSKQ